jgi:mRNA-degrading endonuclease YafQ of YafQ-DinJ toxin-antitoxin module
VLVRILGLSFLMTIQIRHLFSSSLFALCLVILPCTSNTLYSQDLQHDYIPIRSFRAPEKLIHDIQDQYKSWKTSTSLDNKKVKNAFEGFVDQKSRFIFIMDSINVLMYNDTISHFLNSIKDQIVERNEALHGQPYHVFTCRSLEPNAVSLGEGAILVNTGLLERLTTTDEIAFVIAHEMGHDIMNHSYNDGLRYCKSIYEGGFDKKVQKMQRKQAGRTTELKNMMNAFKAQHMQYSRQHELEADSIGFRLAANAGFRKSEAITVLNVLNQADHLRFVDSIVLQNYFQFEGYPFKSYWLDGESSTLSWEADPSLSVTPDSLKSHP